MNIRKLLWGKWQGIKPRVDETEKSFTDRLHDERSQYLVLSKFTLRMLVSRNSPACAPCTAAPAPANTNHTKARVKKHAG